MTIKYKGETKPPNEPHTITWLEYVTLKTECENAASTRQTNAAMGMKLMQQAEKIRKLRKAVKDFIGAWSASPLLGENIYTEMLVKALKETETT